MSATSRLGWLLAAILFAATGVVSAQSAATSATINGVAVDESGGAIPGAVVTATDTQAGVTRTAVTGAEGRFSLTVPPGTYVVRAELNGFVPSQSNPTTLAAGQTASLTLTFKIQAYGETVTVTGSRSPEAIRTTPVAITVVRSDTIDTSAATQFADLLRQVPGLNAIELSPRDVQISTRTATGRSARTTLALLDGRSVYQDYFGMVLWDLMPVNFNELKQVEVLRGPGSAMWGANAMTGVINMITKSPREMLGTEAYAGIGERGTREAGAVHAGADGRLSYKVSGSYFTQEPWARPTQLPDGTPLPAFSAKGTTQYKGDVRLDFDRSDKIKWRFDAGTATSGGVMLVASGPFDVQPMRQSHANAEYTNGSASVTLSINAHKAHYNGLLAPQTVDVSSQSYRIDAKDSRTVGGKHLLVYGGSAAHSHFDLTFAPDAHRREEAGAFLSDDIFINETLRLSGGVRLDYYNTFGASLSPRVGALIEVAKGQTVRATFNRAYVAPSITENFMNFPSSVQVPLPTGNYTLPFVALGDEKLARETIDAGELGYTGVIGRATISVSAYKNRTKGLINLLVEQLYSPTDPPAAWPLPPAALAAIPLPKLFRWTSIGQLDESGVEVGVDLSLARGVSASANYSWQDTPTLSNPTGSVVPFEVNKPPHHRVNVGLQWHRRQFLGSLNASYTDRAFWSDVLSYTGWTNSFWLVNGTIGVTSPDQRFTWLIKGTNLADNAVQQHIFGDIIRRRVLTELRIKF